MSSYKKLAWSLWLQRITKWKVYYSIKNLLRFQKLYFCWVLFIANISRKWLIVIFIRETLTDKKWRCHIFQDKSFPKFFCGKGVKWLRIGIACFFLFLFACKGSELKFLMRCWHCKMLSANQIAGYCDYDYWCPLNRGMIMIFCKQIDAQEKKKLRLILDGCGQISPIFVSHR